MRQHDHGARSTSVAQSDSNGFVNRRSGVQSAPPAPRSQKSVFTRESAKEAVAGFIAGRVSARTAKAALAFLVRNPARRVVADVAAGRLSVADGVAAARGLAS